MLRHLFFDLNAYFASVEQQYRPELRGRPVAVAAVMTERTCCLAASYEAKRFGVKTGTNIAEARRMCPGLVVVEARPPLYVCVHEQVVEAVDRVIQVEKVCSIDEMSCRLSGEDRTPERARAVALAVKRSVQENVGEMLRSSIGIAPNRLLAKVGSDMQKPDGLTILCDEDLPGRLFALKPSDFPGIGPQMTERLRRLNITTTEQLYAADADLLSRAWGSKLIGETWWRRLRGEDLPEVPTHRRTVGHSHVLPPELRSDAGAHGVLVRLIHKAAARLRKLGYCTRTLSVGLDFLGGGGWAEAVRFPYCRDTLTLLQMFEQLWQRRSAGRPLKVSVSLFDLRLQSEIAGSLFEEDRKRSALADAMDQINHKLGSSGVMFGGMLGASQSAPMRIAFTNIPGVLDDWTSDW